MNYYIGLDNGGTLTKAALYTSSGEEVAVCSAATEIAVPHPGYAERDMERMWRTNCDVPVSYTHLTLPTKLVV